MIYNCKNYIIAMVMCVPVPMREYDDEYSLHNNLASLKASKVYICYGLNDDEVSTEESLWYFNQIKAKEKRYHTYQSNHDLPVEWVKDIIEDITK